VALGKGIVRGEENRPGVVVSPRPTPGVSRKGRSTLAHAEGLGKELFAVNKTAGAAVSAVVRPWPPTERHSSLAHGPRFREELERGGKTARGGVLASHPWLTSLRTPEI